jgi:transmembrane sensor
VSEPDWVLLERVAVGEGSEADRAAVEQWIGGDPERQRLFEHIRRIADGTRHLTVGPHFDAAASLRQARSRLGSGRIARSPRVRRPRWRGEDRWPLMAVAAGLLVCLGFGISLTIGRGRREAPPRIYETARGQRATLTLEDGTQVVLAPASHLQVRDRVATLDGEAFFTVAHDAKTPFVVHAGRVTATDLGTRFDVRAYPEEGLVRVVVEEGQVAFATPGGAPPIALARGDLAILPTAGTAQVERGVDTSGLDAWTSGRLEFHDTPARDAVRALSRWYDIDLELGDSSLAAAPLTASFRDEPVDEVLHIVSVTLGARIRRNGRTVILRRP